MKNITYRALIIGIALAVALQAGCSSCEEITGFFVEPAPDLVNPKAFRGTHVAFSYPGNWKATESVLAEGLASAKIIEVESSGNAYLAVQVFTPPLPLDALELLDETTRTMHAEVSRISGGFVRSGDGITTDFNRQLLGAVRTGKRRQLTLEVVGEQVPHTIEVYTLELAELTLAVLTTGADEDMSRLGPGYALVLDSMQLVAR